MKHCKERTCQSNKDGICLGNWAECPAQKPEGKFSVLTMILILVAIGIVCLFMYNNTLINNEDAAETVTSHGVVLPEKLQVPGPEVKQGKYTIFQYCQNGWTNHLYATAYYENDKKIYAELREYPGEFIPIDGQTLPIPEWIETPEELMEYGFWEQGGYE